MKRRSFHLALVALALSACSRGSGKDKPLRVVSLSPSTTETMFAIGAGGLLVGRSRYCDYPKEAEALPVVGGYADPNVEAIIALAPTLVVGARGPAGPVLEEGLRAHGIDTFFPETESLDGITSMVEELGRRVGHEAEAKRVARGIEDKRKALAALVAGRPKKRVLFVFDASPIVVAGPGSFPDELVRLAGGENVITRGGAYPTIGLEHLLALDPDVLLDGASDMRSTKTLRERVENAPGWRELRAVQKGQIRVVGSDVLRPGPRIGDGLFAVARAIHGDSLAPPP
ncbi:ABC transporter substrate-binding protein [Polyangium sp. 15x6]|uniref:ABC transporter substrate-binding protein n=1 Tax=Polyangium sp. 15x6 TaxID=3042687 RepID=UPI00249A2AC5|nr:ABC transporter substrate-binding protein [Polyangium sp. 15x6]MDI3284822.1 ABC transporter substrate-binding protein [Polyangium sp. 15x6]